MVMSCEERLSARLRVDVFDGGPGDGESVVGCGAATDLVEEDERARSGSVEDRGGLGHLDHEGGTAACEIVGGSNAGEDAIDDGESRASGGNPGTHLRHDDD